MAPLLSVIILVYNRREALARTLTEVDAALSRLVLSMVGDSPLVSSVGHGPSDESAFLVGGGDVEIEGQIFEDIEDAAPTGQTGSGPARSTPPPAVATAAPPLEPGELTFRGVKPGHTPDWHGLAEIIVVDNASTDGSSDMVRAEFPHCRILRLDTNIGVAAFNRGAALATGTYLLILDDDAWPDGESLTRALELLVVNSGVAAVMLQPVHPRTGALEWPFDRIKELTRDWPDLRCANLIRRKSWLAVGGYEEHFFLYRNDTDLALKLLGSGRDVAYNPAWRAMHDSPHIAVRRVRWFFLSTRNWCWMCRRHARYREALAPMLMGWLWAHRLAGLSPARHWAALSGAMAGLFRPAPPAPAGVARDGRALRRLIGLKRSLRGADRRRPRPSPPA